MGRLERDKILKQIPSAFTSNNDVIQPRAQCSCLRTAKNTKNVPMSVFPGIEVMNDEDFQKHWKSRPWLQPKKTVFL